MSSLITVLFVAASIILDGTRSAMAPFPTVSSAINAVQSRRLVRSSDTNEFSGVIKNGLLENVRSCLRKVFSFSPEMSNPKKVRIPYVKKLKRLLDKILPPFASYLAQLSDWNVQIIQLNIGIKPNKEPKPSQLTQLSLLLLWRMNYIIINSDLLSKETQSQGMALVSDIVHNQLAHRYFGWYMDGKRNEKQLNKELLTHAFIPKTTRLKALSLLSRARAYIMAHLKPLFFFSVEKHLN